MKCYEFEIIRKVRVMAHNADEAYDKVNDKLSDDEEIVRWERDRDYDCED